MTKKMDRKFTVLAALLIIGSLPAQSQTYTVIHNFAGSPTDGNGPSFNGRLMADSAGNLYGATMGGGASNLGVVFKLDSTGKETILHSFVGSPADGSFPNSDLFMDTAGNLYGTTQLGGASNHGTVYRLDRTGKVTILHSFAGGPADGSEPSGGLVLDFAGNVYGVTAFGGSNNLGCPTSAGVPVGCGTVFKLDPSGTVTILHNFAVRDGWQPSGRLVRDVAGNLYGNTHDGGDFDAGEVFKLDSTGHLTLLHSFSVGMPDGNNPFGGLVRDFAGNFYGTALGGGFSNHGIVFKLDPAGQETLLYSFAGGPADGSGPTTGLVRDLAGNLYGTTGFGGPADVGVVFKLDSTGKETVLHSFAGPDGANPSVDLLHFAGNLYGMTFSGGASNYGVVFRIQP